MPIDARDPARDWAYALLFPMAFSVAISITLFVTLSSLFMALALYSIIRRGTTLTRDFFWKLFLIYFLANALSLTQTHFWPESWRGLLKIGRHILLAFGIAHVVDSPRKMARLVPIFFLTAVIVSLDAFFQGWTGRDLFNGRRMTAFFGEQGRLTGPFKHANDLSAYLTFAASFFLGWKLEGRRFLSSRDYFLTLAGLLLTLAALFGTYSRSGWFVFSAVVFAMGALFKKRWLCAAVGALVVWGIFFSPPLVRMRVQSALDSQAGTVKERAILWGEAGRMIRQSPVLGLGVNTYSRNEPDFRLKDAQTDKQYAHNGYLQMAAEIGLFGLASFLAAIGILLFSSLKIAMGTRDAFLRASGRAFIFAAAAFLGHAAFDTGLHSLLLINLFWMAIGCVWAIRRLSAETV